MIRRNPVCSSILGVWWSTKNHVEVEHRKWLDKFQQVTLIDSVSIANAVAMTKYTLNGDKSACRFIDREAVLLNTETSAYYSMNQTGAFVLRELLVSGQKPIEISRALEEGFSTSTGDWDGDVQQTIAQLEAEGLIVQTDDGTPALSIEGENDVGLPDVYERPILERHGELEQLILSGE